MQIRKPGLFFLMVISIVLLGCKENREAGTPIRIAVASNLHYAINSIVENFESKYGITCQVVLGSSGKLYAQITEGAPYDIFLSADLKYTESLFKAGMTLDQPAVFAYGSLVLWAANSDHSPSLQMLQSDSVKHVALANPKTAPFGMAAAQVLEHYEIVNQISDKLVYGESISQANQFILFGAAEMGFTSLAIVKSPEFTDVGRWILIDSAAYSPLPHSAVLINHSDSSKTGAKAFFEYLFSEEAQVVLKNFGYSTYE
ncbi:molybdate ABC transporter substrate-binding protein [Muriicola soli]|uniref:Molybdate ABC transporter substrate-binding protein n=1 Tax=Muriicola soli TaxID=2507538 RepID=A0A411E840_9FLAO|nr:molybdate ABC transporter substrate-binding protein [Muriicola soli]QBA63620.1 molybdate ABC transporter substrate-binding protein [Muriicola soli]